MFGFKKTTKTTAPAPKISRGDIITFGTYRDVPMTWIILDVKDNNALVISEFLLLQRCVSQENYLVKGQQFETQDLTEWLDHEFFEECFENKDLIRPLNCMDGNEHKLFLLNDQEIKTYFPENEDRVAYLNKLRARKDSGNAGWWWTSTKGKLRNTMNYVDKDGSLKTERFQDNTKGGIRPAMWIAAQEAEKTATKPDDAWYIYMNAVKELEGDEKSGKQEYEEQRAASERERRNEEEKRKTAFEQKYSAEQHYEHALDLIELAGILGEDGANGPAKYAILYLEISLKMGYIPAAEKLAWMYENGVGCEADPYKASEYYKK